MSVDLIGNDRKMGTPDCLTCAQHREFDRLYYPKDQLTERRGVDDWPDEPCLNLKTEVHGLLVSTVFLHIDHAHNRNPPLWYETMVFASPECRQDLYCERYTTKREAIAGHEDTVKAAMAKGLKGFTDEPLEDLLADEQRIMQQGERIMREYREQARKQRL